MRAVTNKDVTIERIQKHQKKKLKVALDNDKDGQETSKYIANEIAKAQKEAKGKEYQIFTITL